MFFNNSSLLIKTDIHLIFSKLFTYPIIFGSLIHSGIISSQHLSPIKNLKSLLSQENLLDITSVSTLNLFLSIE